MLAGLLREDPDRYEGAIYVSRQNAGVFKGLPMTRVTIDGGTKPVATEILSSVKPEAVLIGASIGASLEKRLLTRARKNRIPVFCFVDHYWNLWQRFAHERTAARWHYLPDRIYVIDRKCRERIVSLGCPPHLVRVCAHPGLRAIRNEHAMMSPDMVRRRLKIPHRSGIALFVSEWQYRVSAKWKFEQPRRSDVVHLLTSLLRETERVRERHPDGGPVVVIKLHPAESSPWDPYLSAFDPSLFRVVAGFDKTSLLDASSVVFGLNSMMLLEALARGRRVYSLHKVQENADTWLSTWNRRVRELKSAEDCARVLRKVSAESRG